MTDLRKNGLQISKDMFDAINEFVDTLQRNKDKTKPMIDKFIGYLDDNKIYYHNKFRKSGNTLNEMFSCYAHSCYRIVNECFYYFMQTRNPGDQPKPSMENAPNVYQIKNIDDKPITEKQTEIFLWLLCVTFVKFN